eukprot:3029475-Amphidinium_carterae.1
MKFKFLFNDRKLKSCRIGWHLNQLSTHTAISRAHMFDFASNNMMHIVEVEANTQTIPRNLQTHPKAELHTSSNGNGDRVCESS